MTLAAITGKSTSCLDRIFYFGLLWAETIPTRSLLQFVENIRDQSTLSATPRMVGGEACPSSPKKV